MYSARILAETKLVKLVLNQFQFLLYALGTTADTFRARYFV